MTDGLWTKEQVAEYHQVSPRLVEKWVAAGKLPCVRYPDSNLIRFRPDEVKKFPNSEGDCDNRNAKSE